MCFPSLLQNWLNFSGATSFWVSTSIWESLFNTEKLHFFCIFLRKPLVRMIKKYVFDYFRAFFIVFDHVNACTSIRSLVELQNSFNQGVFLKFYIQPLCKNIIVTTHQGFLYVEVGEIGSITKNPTIHVTTHGRCTKYKRLISKLLLFT